MRKVSLPSGATLEVAPAPFAASKALYQAILREFKGVAFGDDLELADVLKDVFCGAFTSPAVDKALDECAKRCLYNGLKIDDSTFEPVEARDDYILVCMEVAKENIFPFGKSLFAEFKKVSAMIPAQSRQ